MKRVAVFAHYDSHNKIEDYVVYYISELKKIAQNVIFVSDSDVEKDELKKIEPYAQVAYAKHHGEYDFGSYKRGFVFAKENGFLDDCDELILANDSCYAPLVPFSEMFDKMETKNLDFWGVTANLISPEYSEKKVIKVKKEHLQSYFLVLKNNVFNSVQFVEFMNSVKKEKDKLDVVIKYECNLTEVLTNAGFKYDYYCPLSIKVAGSHVILYDKLIKIDKSPFLKRQLVLLKVTNTRYPFFLKRLIKKYTNYNYDLIQKDKNENAEKFEILKHISIVLKSIRRKIFMFHSNQSAIYVFGKKIPLKKRNF